jgi:integrase
MRNITRRERKIMGVSIVKLSVVVPGQKQQYAVRLTLNDGGVLVKRVPHTYPTAPHYTQEPVHIQKILEQAKLEAIQGLLENGPIPRGKYKKCGEAMTAYFQWYATNRPNCRIMFNVRQFNEHFKDMPLTKLTKEEAEKWVEKLIANKYSFDTVRLCIAAGSSMISWLEQMDLWPRKNPFRGLVKHYRRRFPPQMPVKSFISNAEYAQIMTAARSEKYKVARQYIEIARCTGLRPSEIYRLDTELLNRDSMTWSVLVTKTTDRQFFRTIAVPQYLVAFIANENISGKFPYTEYQVRMQIESLRKEVGIFFTQKTFRKDFAQRMELAGAAPDIINLHQGRGQSGVIFQHYLTDPNRAVRVCRQYITSMFSEKAKLAVVK